MPTKPHEKIISLMGYSVHSNSYYRVASETYMFLSWVKVYKRSANRLSKLKNSKLR